MRLVDALRLAAREPARAAFHLVAPHAAPLLWARYAAISRRQGFDRPRLLVSFDCETAMDVAALPSVLSTCSEIGLKCAVAAPGVLIEEHAKVFLDAADRGTEFINHGYLVHTVPNDERPGLTRTSFTYAQLTMEQIHDDIWRGDRAHRSVLGYPPAGFRTPHFGSFQRKAQLRTIHREAANLGYLFSTSTIPMAAFARGPLIPCAGIVEIPLSGAFSSPNRLLDSWGFTAAPARTADRADFERELGALASYLSEARTGLVNVYADPSHVEDWDGFFAVLSGMADLSATFLDVVRRRPT